MGKNARLCLGISFLSVEYLEGLHFFLDKNVVVDSLFQSQISCYHFYFTVYFYFPNCREELKQETKLVDKKFHSSKKLNKSKNRVWCFTVSLHHNDVWFAKDLSGRLNPIFFNEVCFSSR